MFVFIDFGDINLRRVICKRHMYLVTAATEFEMQPFRENCLTEGVREMVTGVGPVETAVRLMAFLNGYSGKLHGIINFGAGGAYLDPSGIAQANLLDICLAEKEVFGDLGICLEDSIERITGKGFEIPDTFDMDTVLFDRASQALREDKIPFSTGNFVTVSCTTGTAVRGAMLARRHSGLCENMEGAAVARVCQEFRLPCLEVRCISNLVEDRDTSRWKLKQACKRSGEVTATIVHHLETGKHG